MRACKKVPRTGAARELERRGRSRCNRVATYLQALVDRLFVAPGGQQEFYGADDWRALTWAALTVDGADAGLMAPLPADFGVGLSAFPTQPASVRVGTIIRPVPDRG